MNCAMCKNFDKRRNICIEKRMGDSPEYYDKPKWMGCSYYEKKDNYKQESLISEGVE
jgi:hypothetical protein